jgi:hypothetical protein
MAQAIPVGPAPMTSTSKEFSGSMAEGIYFINRVI